MPVPAGGQEMVVFGAGMAPCRSYRFRARLQRTTTAWSAECFTARRVRAAIPAPRNSRCPRSAQSMHKPFSPSLRRKSPSSSCRSHSAHAESLLRIWNTTMPEPRPACAVATTGCRRSPPTGRDRFIMPCLPGSSLPEVLWREGCLCRTCGSSTSPCACRALHRDSLDRGSGFRVRRHRWPGAATSSRMRPMQRQIVVYGRDATGPCDGNVGRGPAARAARGRPVGLLGRPSSLMILPIVPRLALAHPGRPDPGTASAARRRRRGAWTSPAARDTDPGRWRSSAARNDQP